MFIFIQQVTPLYGFKAKPSAPHTMNNEIKIIPYELMHPVWNFMPVYGSRGEWEEHQDKTRNKEKQKKQKKKKEQL